MGQSKDKVILQLLGIDKKWVKNESNEWVEYIHDEVETEINLNLIEEKEEKANPINNSKKWWQFWIKNKNE